MQHKVYKVIKSTLRYAEGDIVQLSEKDALKMKDSLEEYKPETKTAHKGSKTGSNDAAHQADAK